MTYRSRFIDGLLALDMVETKKRLVELRALAEASTGTGVRQTLDEIDLALLRASRDAIRRLAHALDMANESPPGDAPPATGPRMPVRMPPRVPPTASSPATPSTGATRPLPQGRGVPVANTSAPLGYASQPPVVDAEAKAEPAKAVTRAPYYPRRPPPPGHRPLAPVPDDHDIPW